MAKNYTVKILINAQDNASRVLRGVGGSMQGLGKVALGAAAVAAGAMVGIGAGMAKLALDAAPLEGVQAAFEGIAESSGESADDVLAALQRGSAGMIAQRDLMSSYNSAAQLVGTTFANQLPDAMGYLGKVSAATGEDMGYMMDSLVKGVGRLSPMILDNLGIQVALSEATDEAAKMFGVEASELTKAQTQAGMMNVVLAKLEENTAAMPEVTGTAVAGIAGLKAGFQDLKDRLGLALLPTMNELMGVFGDLTARVLPVVTDFFENRLAPALEMVASIVSDFVSALFEGETPLIALQDALASLGLGALADTIGLVVARVGELWAIVQPYLEQVMIWISENVQLQDVLIALGVAIASVIVPAIVSLLATIAPVIAAFVGAIAVAALLREAWVNDWLGIRTAIENAVAAISTAIQGAIALWQGLWSAHGAQIQAAAQAAWTGIQAVIQGVMSVVQSLMAAWTAAREGNWTAFGENLRVACDTAWNGIKTIFSNAGVAIGTIITNLVTNIKAKFTGTDWGSVGRSIIEGIKAGVASAVQGLAAAAAAAAKAALDAAKGFLGVHSPSTAFAQVGRSMMEGWAEGVAANISLPVAQVDYTSQQLLMAGDSGGGRGGGGQLILAPIVVQARDVTTAAGEWDWQAVAAIVERGRTEYL